MSTIRPKPQLTLLILRKKVSSKAIIQMKRIFISSRLENPVSRPQIELYERMVNAKDRLIDFLSS